MSIGHYIKIIGRGKDGARALPREQAADLLGQVLDGTTSDLEIGAFCLAMRIKGETPEEMAGFLDALHQRMALLPDSACCCCPQHQIYPPWCCPAPTAHANCRC